MRRRKKLLLLLAAIALAAIALTWFFHKPEPSYNGRPLSEWAHRVLEYGSSSPRPFERQPEAEDAIRHIGTNAFPWVLRCLQRDRVRTFDNIMSKLPGILRRPYKNWVNNYEQRRAIDLLCAGGVLRILNADARPLAPELLRLSYQTNSDVCHDAIQLLGSLGTNGMPQLLQIIRDRTHNERRWVMLQLFLNDPGGRSPAVPVLIECLGDPENQIADAALQTLTFLSPPCDVVAEPLKKLLSSTNQLVLSRATNAINTLCPEVIGESARIVP